MKIPSVGDVINSEVTIDYCKGCGVAGANLSSLCSYDCEYDGNEAKPVVMVSYHRTDKVTVVEELKYGSEVTAPDDPAARVVELFLSGESVNQIVYLMDYKLDTGEVCAIIRNCLIKLNDK